MGTTASEGQGSKGRAANGDQPVGTASYRQEQYTKAACQNPLVSVKTENYAPIGEVILQVDILGPQSSRWEGLCTAGMGCPVWGVYGVSKDPLPCLGLKSFHEASTQLKRLSSFLQVPSPNVQSFLTPS